MGEKEKARAAMKHHGVPILPGSDGIIAGEKKPRNGRGKSDIPVIIKASAGGGGRGMRIVRNEQDLPRTLHRRHSRKLRRRSVMATSTWRNSSSTRATSSSKFLPTSTAML